MNIRPGIIIVIVALFALLVGGRVWFGNKKGDGTAPSAATAPNNDASSEPTRVATSTPPPPAPAPTPVPPPVTPRPPGRAALPTPPVAPANDAAGKITNWEQRIDDVLTAEGEENKKARDLLGLLPNLPEDGQVEAAQHISNLLPDEEYASLAPTLTNAATPEAVLDVLMTDVLNRPNGVKLGTLLDVARAPNHPKAEEARDVLEVFVDENYGTDWAAWDAAVKKWLAENPDE